MFQIELTEDAIEDLREFRKIDRKRILDEAEAQLTHQPNIKTQNRKRLRPNKLAEWELRLGRFRVFYDVDLKKQLIKVEAVGYKEGSHLFIRGTEYQL